ncbi:hypothetical protein [Coprobacter sp.]
MKKIIYLLCLSALSLTFTSCNDDDDETKKPTTVDEIDENIMYSFDASSQSMSNTLDVKVILRGEETGKAFSAPEDINIPFEVDSKSSAKIGTDYTIEGYTPNENSTSGNAEGNESEAKIKHFITVKAGTNEGTVRFTAGESVTSIKNIILKINAPEKNSDKFYPGNYEQMGIYITKANTNFSSFAGNWEPVEITNKMNWLLMEIPTEDYTNLPETFNAGDYLELVDANGTQKIIPHVAGSLKNYFCGTEHEVSFLSVENFWDYSIESFDGIDIVYYTIKGANKYFSATRSEAADLKIGFYKVDDNTINIFIHEYVPTDFFYSSFNDTFAGDWNFNAPSVFGITYKFTRMQ